MIDVKRFSGVLNCDDKEQDVLPEQHIHARNIKLYGGPKGLTAQNVKGNYAISNSSLPSGTNECLGAFDDKIKERIIWFNWNDGGANGIYVYTIQTNTITKVFLSLTDSATDILKFNLDYPIASVALVYRTEGEGDLLYWTDGYNRPRYLNLDTTSTIQPFTEDMINAAKLPPLAPPSSVSYASDSNYSSNRVKNKYFQFAYRWTYVDFFKSTLSPWSEVAIPPNIIQPNGDINTTTNNVIQLSVLSASSGKDFTGIEIVAREWLGAAWSDFFLIQTVTTKDITTPLPFLYSFSFYNNSNYSPIPTDDSDLYFDHLPDKAIALELLNGNVLIYGGATDGYDPLTRQDVNVQITTTLINSSSYPAVSTAWKWAQYYRFGLQYFDKIGKPIGGVVSFLKDSTINTTNFDFTTPEYTSEVNGSSYKIPIVNTIINHIPPQDAESYCWVRANLIPPYFLQWMTNDYQFDNEYLYLCIQSLLDANTKTGFLPSYEFTAGDRVRVLAKFVSTETTTVYVPQLDFQILEVVQKIMGSGNPALNGAFLKVKRPSGFVTYSSNNLIEIYTPSVGLTDNTAIFYEWGQRYGFQTISTVKYHLGGTQNQTASLPALTSFTNGDVYLKQRQIYPTIAAATYTLMVQDRNYNDYQPSAANSNGRGWVIDPNAKKVFNGVISRWGGAYQPGTNINNLNRFRPNDYDEADRSKGTIRRYKARDRILRVFQDRGIAQYGIYGRFIQNNEGVPELVTTNEIITTNNIQYYQGTFGIGGYVTNLCSGAQADYVADLSTGREIRLSADGITDLGLLYKGQYYLSSLVIPYNKENLRTTNGKIAKVMKFWDSYENEAHTILQAGVHVPDHPNGLLIIVASRAVSSILWQLAFFGAAIAGDVVKLVCTSGNGVTETFQYICANGDTAFAIRTALINQINLSSNFGATTTTIGVFPGMLISALENTITVSASIIYFNSTSVDNYNYCFNERRNAFTGFFDYFPDWALSVDDIIYSWKEGVLYKHAVNGNNYCNFYGTQYPASITAVFNPNVGQKKTWESIAEVADTTWVCPTIYTDTKTYGSKRQESTIVEQEFVVLEGMPSASFKRDIFSRGGKWNGDWLKGNIIVVKFQKTNASSLVNLHEIVFRYIDSPLNVQ